MLSPLSSLLVAALGAAAPQEPLVDINQAVPTVPADSSPADFATLNGATYFAADVPGLGRELCVFDGSQVDLFVDALPGSASLAPSDLAAAAGRLWFAGASDVGRELWVSDGTPSGTTFVADLVPEPFQSGNPRGFVEFGSDVLFVARTPTFGHGVWRSDGTEAGTIPLVSLDEGVPQGSADVPEQITVVGNQAFFTTFFGSQLWVTDGTPAGTQRIAPEFIYTGIDWLVGSGGYLYFLARDASAFSRRVWRTNGGPPELVASPTLPEAMTLFNGALYITARDANGDWAIFSSDLTPGNLTHVATPLPGTGAYFRELVAAQTYLAFAVDEDAQGEELWRTDGTAAGTSLIQEAVPGSGGLDPTDLTAVGDRIVFSGTVIPGAEPWVTDGQSVVPLADLALFTGSDPAEFYSDGTQLWFAATSDAVGREAYRTDGTPAGTALAGDLAETPLTLGSDPRDLVRIGTRVVFTADDGVHGREPWASDGTPEGTWLLADVLPGGASSEVEELVVLGDRVYFIARESSAISLPRIEVWRTDGTPEGTERFTALHPSGLYYPQNLASAGGLLFFEANDFDTLGWEPYVSDGEGGIRLLGNLNPNLISKDSDPYGYTALDDVVLFSARDSLLQTRLYRTDGTPQNTVIVDAGNPDYVQGVFGIQPIGDGRALMTGFGGGQGVGSPTAIGQEAWVTDGTAAGTFPLADIAPGSQGSKVAGFFPLAGAWAFTAENADLGRELWITDGTVAGTQLLHETVVGPGDLDPQLIGVLDGKLYYRAGENTTDDLWATDGVTFERVFDVPNQLFAQGVTGALLVEDERLYFNVNPVFGVTETWSTDGTPAGTQRLDVVEDGFALSEGIAVGQGPEIVTASVSDAAGAEVWTTRGDAATVALLRDVNPGAASSLPRDFLRVGDTVLFTAQDHTLGRELYAVPFADTLGHVLEPYGSGCPGALGVAPQLTAQGEGRLGEVVQLELSDAFPSSVAYLFLGFDSAPTPLDDCTQYPTDPLFPFAILPTAIDGTATLPLFLPPTLPGLIGDPVYFQFAVIDPAGGFGNAVTLSNALEAIVGPAF